MDVGTMTLCPGPGEGRVGYCDYCRSRGRSRSGFRKMLETKEGVVVYQRTTRQATDASLLSVNELPFFSESATTAAVLDNIPESTKKMPPDDNTIIIVHNTTENDVQSADFLPEFDIDLVSCPRCRYKMKLAKKLLASMPVIERRGVKTVCDMCALKQLSRYPCHVCQSIIKEFEALGIKDDRLDENRKKRIMSYVTSAKRILKPDVIDEKPRLVRSFSECNIAKIIERRRLIDQRLKRPKSGPDIDVTVSQYLGDKDLVDVLEKKKVTIQEEPMSEVFKTEIAIEEMYHKKLEKAMEGMLERKKVRIQKEQISETPKTETSIEKMYYKKVVDKIDVQKDLDEINLITFKPVLKTPRVVITPPAGAQFPAFPPKQKFPSPDRVDAKITPYRAGDVAKPISDTVLGIGTTGVMRRARSDDSLITSFTGITEAIYKKNLKYFFPRNIKEDERLVKTSAELIKDTQDKIQSKLENKKRKKEELLKMKIKKEQEKEQAKEKAKEELRRKIELAKREGIIPPDDDISYEIDKKTGLLVAKKKGKKRGRLLDDVKKGERLEKGRKKISEKGKKETVDKELRDKGFTSTRKFIGKEKHELREKALTDKNKKEKDKSDRKEAKDKYKLTRKEKEELSDDQDVLKGKRKLKIKEGEEYGGKDRSDKAQRKRLGKQTLSQTLSAKSVTKSLATMRDIMMKQKQTKQSVKVKAEQKGEADKKVVKVETIDEKVGSGIISDTQMPTKEGITSEDIRLAFLMKKEEVKEIKALHEQRTIPENKIIEAKSAPKKQLVEVDVEEKEENGKLTKDHVKLVNKVLTKQENIVMKQKKLKVDQETRLAKLKKRADKAIQPVQDEVYEEYVNKKKPPPPKTVEPEKIPTLPTLTKKIEVPMDQIKMQSSGYDLISKLISIKTSTRDTRTPKKVIEALPVVSRKTVARTQTDLVKSESTIEEGIIEDVVSELVLGTEIVNIKDVPPEPETKSLPILFETEFHEGHAPKSGLRIIESPSETSAPSGQGPGVFRYTLSDRQFINNGWTLLPEEKIIRKMNVYRMRPTQPKFDWFEHHKGKGIIQYDTGEKLAEINRDGRGRWYYKNGRLALDYYDSEEANAQQRFVLYSSGQVDARGRSQPVTILGMFDYMGNGIVFDHSGKIRLKYNQSEGVLLDREIGPVSHWKWHSLNDPPELQQVMIDTHLGFKDPEILAYADQDPKVEKQEDENMLAIEFENFVKSKHIKPTQKFKPFQIRLKVLKINDQFSLRVLDQKTIYLIFSDGSTKIKLNIGMELDHNDIVDTSSCELGQVTLNIENKPAVTKSIENLQKNLANTKQFHRVRRARELWKRPPPPGSNMDKLMAAATKPLRPTLQTADPISSRRIVGTNNLYYNTRLI